MVRLLALQHPIVGFIEAAGILSVLVIGALRIQASGMNAESLLDNIKEERETSNAFNSQISNAIDPKKTPSKANISSRTKNVPKPTKPNKEDLLYASFKRLLLESEEEN